MDGRARNLPRNVTHVRYVRTVRAVAIHGAKLRKHILKRDKAFIWAALRAPATKRGSFIAAGAFDVILLPDDLIHLLIALPHADIAGSAWTDPSPARQRVCK